MLSKVYRPQEQAASSFHLFQSGMNAGIPIMIGYLPISITYGVLAKQAGMSLTEIVLMSVLVFAGASQFMGVSMIALGTGFVEIIIATFVLNFRHFIMSFSLMNRAKKLERKWKIFLSFGLTDETFAVSSQHIEEAKRKQGAFFYAAIMLSAYLSWIFGSFLGGILGEIIPRNLSQSMGIALYAMFIGLLIPSVKKEWRVGIIAIISMIVTYICNLFMNGGWAIVLGTVLGGGSGVFLLGGKGK